MLSQYGACWGMCVLSYIEGGVMVHTGVCAHSHRGGDGGVEGYVHTLIEGGVMGMCILS